MAFRHSLLALVVLASCTKLPEKPGFYASDKGKLLNLEITPEIPELSPKTEFIYYGEDASIISKPQLLRLNFVRNRVAGPLTSGIKLSPLNEWYWFEFNKQTAQTDSTPQIVNLFAHPIKGHPDMVRFTSLNPIPPGVYTLQLPDSKMVDRFSVQKADIPKFVYDEWITVSWYQRFTNLRPAAELDLVLWNNARTEARKLATQGNREEATKKCEEAKAIPIPEGFVPKASKIKYEPLDCTVDVNTAYGAGRLTAAKQSFYSRKYDAALQACDESLSATPDNAEALKLKEQILAVKSALGQ